VSRISVLEASDRAALDAFAVSGWDPGEEVAGAVARIIDDVRRRGDDALVDYARRFDDPAFKRDRLRVQLPSRAEARSLVPPDVAAGLELARERVRAFHERQRSADVEYDERDGTRYAVMTRPLTSVGAYVPGGTASLPSSVVMTVVPAKVAGVPRVVVATPPSRNGSINPAILFACALCEADEVYAAGGAQAIAAMAYGTSTVAAVDKIVGPGNVWVTEAKRQVFGKVGIDGLAGPSEVLVVADEQARADFVAGEMLAQAEHDPRSRVAAISTSRSLLEKIAELLEAARASGERGEIVRHVLDNSTWLIHANSEDQMLEVAECFAPEHLSVQTREPMAFARRVRHAGAVFAGPWTPVAAGDYIAGTNHVLPTAGAARFASGLRLADFTRTISVVEYSRERMLADAEVLESLATFEGLPAHARSATMRKP
jgi:histidinol dehydrogenase